MLAKAGMNPEDVVTAMCLSCGIPTILSGLFGNLPFVMAPGVKSLCNFVLELCDIVCLRVCMCLCLCVWLSLCARARWWTV